MMMCLVLLMKPGSYRMIFVARDSNVSIQKIEKNLAVTNLAGKKMAVKTEKYFGAS